MDPVTTRDLLADSRLSDSARVLAIWMMLQTEDEEGFVAAPYDDLRPLLHGIPSTETVGKHVRMLEGCGWLERRPGGRGNPDRFRLAPPRNRGLNIDPPHNRDLSENRPPLEPGSKTFSPPLEPGAKPPAGGDYRGGKEFEEVDEVEENPPVVPPSGKSGRTFAFELDPKADQVIEARAEQLNGCRGSFRDYLRARVPEHRQYAFAQTVAAWLDGTNRGVFRKPDGTAVPEADRTRLLASAFNELGASDEEVMKRPVGDPGNLKTKLGILCMQAYSTPPTRGERPPRANSGTMAPTVNPIAGDKSRRRGGAA